MFICLQFEGTTREKRFSPYGRPFSKFWNSKNLKRARFSFLFALDQNQNIKFFQKKNSRLITSLVTQEDVEVNEQGSVTEL